MNYWWWWWCCQSPISCRIPGEKNVGPGLVCTKVGLAIVVGDLWPGFSINVGMEPPTAMKKRFSRSQSPTAVGKPRYVHGKTRRSGHSATAGLCKAWWLMGRICLASSHMQDSSNIEQHTYRSLRNPEIGELKFGAQIQRQRLGRTFLLARIPKHPTVTLNEAVRTHSWRGNQTCSGWWFQPLWKIWVRQLGLFFTICGKS